MYRTVPGKGEGRREDTKEKDGGRINRTTYLVEGGTTWEMEKEYSH